MIFDLMIFPPAAPSAGCTLTPARSIPKHDRQHSRRGAPSSPGGAEIYHRWPEAAPALGSGPLLTHGGFDDPMGFQGSHASKLVGTAEGGATREAPRTVGTGQPLLCLARRGDQL